MQTIKELKSMTVQQLRKLVWSEVKEANIRLTDISDKQSQRMAAGIKSTYGSTGKGKGQAFANELNNILDEIRTEIEHYNHRTSNYPCDIISINTVLQIIDKYKAESNERVRMSKEQLKAINDFWKEYTGRELYKNADNKRTEKHDS